MMALNVVDMARARGISIDQAKLSALLGHIPVIETVGNKGQGIDSLLETMTKLVDISRPKLRLVA